MSDVTESASNWAENSYGLRRNTSDTGERVGGYVLTTDRSGRELRSQTSRLERRRGGEPHAKIASANRFSSERAVIRASLKSCEQYSAEMVESKAECDAMAVAVAGISLIQVLAKLWECRAAKDQIWCEVLSFLQSALASEEFERFTLEQCLAVQKVVKLLSEGLLDTPDSLKARQLLRGSGLDPWKAISSIGA